MQQVMPKLELKAEQDPDNGQWLVTSPNVRGLCVSGTTINEAMKRATDIAGHLSYLNDENPHLAHALLTEAEKAELEPTRQELIEDRKKILQDLADNGEHLVYELNTRSQDAANGGAPVPADLVKRASTVLALMGLPEKYQKLRDMGVWSEKRRDDAAAAE